MGDRHPGQRFFVGSWERMAPGASKNCKAARALRIPPKWNEYIPKKNRHSESVPKACYRAELEVGTGAWPWGKPLLRSMQRFGFAGFSLWVYRVVWHCAAPFANWFASTCMTRTLANCGANE